MDAKGGGRSDRAKIRHSAWFDGDRGTAREAQSYAAKAAAAGISTRLWRDNLREKSATIRMILFGRGVGMIVAERQ